MAGTWSVRYDAFRRQQETLGYRREETRFVVRQVSLHGDPGFIGWSHLDSAHARQVIRDEVAYFRRLGQPFEWKVYPGDPPEPLQQLLQAEGFQVGDPESVMVTEVAPNHSLLTPVTGWDLQELESSADIADLVRLLEEVWDTPFASLGRRLIRDKQAAPERLRLYGIYRAGRLVSGAWMYVEHPTPYASLWGGATLPAYRGLGCYTALLRARAQAARCRGLRYLTVDAGPMSRPILERQGFVSLGFTYPCESPV